MIHLRPSSLATRAPLLTYVVGAFGIAAAKIFATVASGPQQLPYAFTSDDAFYYFETAINVARGQGSTFDGVTRTNGYQPLWFWLLVPIFYLFNGRRPALIAVTILSALLWLAAAFLMWALLRSIARAAIAPVGLIPFIIVGYGIWFTGVEFPLVVTALLAVLLVIQKSGFLSNARPPSVPRLLALGGLLVVLELSRLDATAVVVVVVVAGCWRWRNHWRASLGAGIIVAGPPILALLAYVGWNQWAFGTPLPVSGQAKQLAGPTWNPAAIFEFLTYGDYVSIPLLLGIVTYASALMAMFTRISGTASELRVARYLLLVLLLAQTMQLAYYATASSWRMEPWYYYMTVPTLGLALTVLANAALERMGIRNEKKVAAIWLTVVALLVLGFAARVTWKAIKIYHPGDDPVSQDLYAAHWVNAHAGVDERLAMGDWAGTFSYYADRPVLQLEGLVSSPEYLESLRTNTVPDFLEAHNVAYIVKIIDSANVIEDSARPGCQLVQEPIYGSGPKARLTVCDSDLVYEGRVGSSELCIWRYRPSLQR